MWKVFEPDCYATKNQQFKSQLISFMLVKFLKSKLVSGRSSMKIMVGVYRSRFHTIDYSMISHESVQHVIFRSVYIK